MNIPEWLKPALFGAAAGGVAIAIVGFSWGGWVGAGTAEQMASDRARDAVVTALAPICVEQATRDPQLAMTLARLKDVRSYERPNEVMAIGWATMPGSSEPNRAVATACMEVLATRL